MRHLTLALGLAVMGHLASATVAAAAPDTWVSGTGADVGDCRVTAPCRSFQYALKYTKRSGIIAVQSSGSFAGVRIKKPVSIVADGVVAIIRTGANCGAAVCVDTTGVVTLRGLTIDPLGTGIHGISVLSASRFHLKQSVVRQSRIGLFAKNTLGTNHIEVSDSIFTGNSQAITIVAIGETKAALDRVRALNNVHGIVFDDSARTGTIVASVTDSVIAGHTGRGIYAVTGDPGVEPPLNISVTLDRTAVLDNHRGITVDGAAARVRIGNSTITGNGIALRSINSGAIPSYGTNKLDGNGSGEAPTGIIPNQ